MLTNEQKRTKARKVTLRRYDLDLKMWSCTFFSMEDGVSKRKIGYINAPKDCKTLSKVKARRIEGQTVKVPSQNEEEPNEYPFLRYIGR